MNWEIIKIILGILFILSLFVLITVIIGLANSKKRFLLYAEQIQKTGKIEQNIGLVKVQFDLFIAAYIFSDIPTKTQRPEIYLEKKMLELKDTIDRLTKILKPVALFFAVLTVTLIVLLNIYEN